MMETEKKYIEKLERTLRSARTAVERVSRIAVPLHTRESFDAHLKEAVSSIDQALAGAAPGPAYFDGEPINLEAAALDALEWLEFWRKLLLEDGQVSPAKRVDALDRMARAIGSLKEYLPGDLSVALYTSRESNDG